MSTWIRTADKLPENEGMYIAAVMNKSLPNKIPDVVGLLFVDGEFMQDNRPLSKYLSGQYYVTHWDYLPFPPSDPY